MRFLYAFNGTGYGHAARAALMIEALRQQGEVDVLVSCEDRPLELNVTLKYRFQGFHLCFSNGRMSTVRCILDNSLSRFIKDMRSLDAASYDHVISDFEPISCWHCQRNKYMHLTHISNQAAFHYAETPRYAKKNWIFETFIKRFCPAPNHIAIHYDRYHPSIHYPLIKRSVLELQPVQQREACTVYLSIWPKAQILELLADLPDIQFDVFCREQQQTEDCGHIRLHPIHNEAYLDLLGKNQALLTTAGFEATSEAMYLGKMLMVLPIANHYEQYCNATALSNFGVSVAWPEQHLSKQDYADSIRSWWQQQAFIHRPFYTSPSELIKVALQ